MTAAGRWGALKRVSRLRGIALRSLQLWVAGERREAISQTGRDAPSIESRAILRRLQSVPRIRLLKITNAKVLAISTRHWISRPDPSAKLQKNFEAKKSPTSSVTITLCDASHVIRVASLNSTPFIKPSAIVDCRNPPYHISLCQCERFHERGHSLD